MHRHVDIDRIPSKELAKTSTLTSLWQFANIAFDGSSRKHPELGFEEGLRFERPEDFIEEMGPRGVTFIQYAPNSESQPGEKPRIIATAGCKPFQIALKLEERVKRMREEREARENDATTNRKASDVVFYTKEHEDQLLQQIENVGPMTHSDGQEDIPRWEVMTVCVHEDWQKQGLAAKLLELVREEVSSQVKSEGKGPEFKLVVRVLKEINEKYWLSKCFKPVGEKFFMPGASDLKELLKSDCRPPLLGFETTRGNLERSHIAMDYSNIFRLVNLAVGGLMILGGIGQFFVGGFQSIILGCYVVIFGAATLLLEFQIPPAVSRWAPFLFSFIGRGIFYVFVGSILLHKPIIWIVAGSIIGIVGVGYVILEYIPQIEPPQNMRDAGGEWGAEQI
ncbi:MAG: hypothetical protein Q9170_005417 [Blastenia crenularia]